MIINMDLNSVKSSSS